MAVSIEDIKKLRHMTGAGMMDCKNAPACAAQFRRIVLYCVVLLHAFPADSFFYETRPLFKHNAECPAKRFFEGFLHLSRNFFFQAV